MKRVMQVKLFVWEFHGNQAILVDILPHRGILECSQLAS